MVSVECRWGMHSCFFVFVSLSLPSFRWSIVWLNPNLLPQVSTAFLARMNLKLGKRETLPYVLQAVPIQVRTDLYNYAQIQSFFSPFRTSDGVPHWEYWLSSARLPLSHGGGRTRAMKTPRDFPAILKLQLS